MRKIAVAIPVLLLLTTITWAVFGPVKLKPGHAYAIAFNTEKFRNFQDAAGQPAMPYLLAFETKP
jgi:hypothetical protein